jgi:inner membrane protein
MPRLDCDAPEERSVPRRLLSAAPTAGLFAILLLDGAQRAKAWPVPVVGMLDESAHLITAALVLGSMPRGVARPVWPWVLIGAVAIDVDHLPLYLGAREFAVDGGRPPSHCLALVLLLLAGAARPALRAPLLGLAAGVMLHMARDMATGPGVPLLWPLLPKNVLLPYPGYVVLMALATIGSTIRSAIRFHHGRERRWQVGYGPANRGGGSQR